mgnify:CR=1 FL=1
MSTINWFPGHMHKARKEIAEVMPHVDVVIEVPEKGKVVQYGRFNQGGEIDIF